MKKEKQVKTYQRRTKSGKVTTVKAHTAKYDAAEAAKEALKKAGAGKEFEKKKSNKIDASSEISPEDFKAWYHWDIDDDPKNEGALRAEKQLKKKLGTKGYKEFFDKATDSYSARGHNKAFKEVCSEKGSKEDTKTSKVDAKAEKSKSAKVKTSSEKEGSKRKSSRFDVTYANSTDPEGVIEAYKSVSEHTKHILRKIGYKFNMQPVDVDASYYNRLDEVCKSFSDDGNIDVIRWRIVRQFGDNEIPNIIPRKGTSNKNKDE